MINHKNVHINFIEWKDCITKDIQTMVNGKKTDCIIIRYTGFHEWKKSKFCFHVLDYNQLNESRLYYCKHRFY